MIECLLSRPGLIAGPLHSKPFQIISQSIPRLDPIDSKSSSKSDLDLEGESEAAAGWAANNILHFTSDDLLLYV